jgi:hypothetical protein
MKRLLVALFLLAFGTVGCIRVPKGLNVVVTDNPEPYCLQRSNCYVVATRTIVLVPNQSIKTAAHELCHAAQHETVLRELGREPRGDLVDWYDTDEAREYAAAVGDAPVPADWELSAPTLLERFAEHCARYMVNDSRWASDPVRDTFFSERAFR